MNRERRQLSREKVQFPVLAVTANGLMRAVTENISPSGLCMYSPKHLRNNEKVLLTIGGGSSEKRVLGRIVWSRLPYKEDGRLPAKVGVRFLGDPRSLDLKVCQVRQRSGSTGVLESKVSAAEEKRRKHGPEGRFLMPAFEERRRNHRTAIEWPVVVKTGQGFVGGVTVNVSADGVSVLCKNPPQKGEILAVGMRIPEAKRSLLVMARVAWSDADDLPFDLIFHRIGARFMNLTQNHRLFLLSALSENIKREKSIPARVEMVKKAVQEAQFGFRSHLPRSRH